MDHCKPEVRPGAREESASPAWLATPDINAKQKVFTPCGKTEELFNFLVVKRLRVDF